MRRILFITRSTTGIGGMQTYTRTLLAGLRRDPSVDLHVCAWRGPVMLLPFFSAYACMRALFFRGDVCHIGDALLSPIAPCIRFFRPRLRLTLTTYGLDVIYPLCLYQWMLRRSLPLFDAIVAISHATAEELKKRSVTESRIVTIPPGIDVPPSPPVRTCPSTHQMLILGRQIKRKGTVWFLRDVMPRLMEIFPSITLVIAGDGPELPLIHSLARAEVLRDHVSVLGSVDDRTKERLLVVSTLLIVPNIAVRGDMEGFGLVCTEATTHGLPVVASRREGLIDAVVEGVTGLLYTSEDADSAVHATTQALRMSWDTARMHQVLDSRYSINVMCSQYVNHVF